MRFISPAMVGIVGLAITASVVAAPARFVVMFDNDTSAANAINAITSRVDTGWRHVRHNASGGEVFDVPEGSEEALKAMPGVRSVHANQRLKVLRAEALPWQLGGGPAGINVEGAWAYTRGSGVTVAVIDTGIVPHAAIKRVRPGHDFIDDAKLARDGDGRDALPIDEGTYGFRSPACPVGEPQEPSSWHGLNVVGVIAAAAGDGVAGVAPEVDILPIRVAGGCDQADLFDVADAIVWASGGEVEGIPSLAKPADVINLSLGYPGECNEVYAEAVSQAISRGSIVVAAAGNDPKSAVNTPASCKGVIGVAALDHTGSLASYATRGVAVSVSAPGGREDGSPDQMIETTSNAGRTVPENESYTHTKGSSFATPLVAGVVALMRAIKPDLSAADARRLIEASARPGCGAGCGHGRLDATATIEALIAEMP
jgi:serine protease